MTTSKNNRFNDQNNSSTRASHFLVHFFDAHCTTTTPNLSFSGGRESVKGSGNSAFLQKDQLYYLKRAEKLTFCIYFS